MDVLELLSRVREERCEVAFEELMRRYSRMVYSVAWRRLRDQSLAEECVQEVFVRFAGVGPRLRSEGELVGWLHATAHHVAIDRWRKETRRREREEKAGLMELSNEPEAAHWSEVAPLLDEALEELGAVDRQAILLRYFQSESLRAVGAALGLSEDAAKARVRRALEKLQGILGKRGITCSAAVLTVLLEKNSVEGAIPCLWGGLAASNILSQAGASQGGVGASLIATSIILMKSKVLIVLLATVLGCWWLLRKNHDQSASLRRPTAERTPEAEGAKRGTSFTRRGPRGLAKMKGDLAAERLTQLRSVLKEARRVKAYPPGALVEALWVCGDIATNAVDILKEALASPDYETRHWAVAGLQLISQDVLKSGQEPARVALAQVAISPAEPDELRIQAMMNAFPRTFGIEAARPPAEPISREVLAIFASSFEAKGIEMANHNMMLADMVNQHLLATGQDHEEYRARLAGLVRSGDADQRLGAAYALSGLPGEKPAEVKKELVRALEEDSPRSPNAMVARGLGRLGTDAEDALPVLQAFLAKHPEAGPIREETEQAMVAIQPDLMDRFPELAKKKRARPSADEPVAEHSSLRQMVLGPLLVELRDPERWKEFVLEDHWWGVPVWAVNPLRDAFQEAAAESEPEMAALIGKLADRIEPILPEDEEEWVELPSVGELFGRADGVSQVAENRIPAAVSGPLQKLAAKYQSWWGFGERKTTREDLRRAAADLRALNEELYRATMKSFLEYHPELDRVFR